MTALIVIIVLLAVVVGGYAAWKSSRPALPPGQRPGAIPPGQPHPTNPQQFTPQSPQAGGYFVEQRRTKPGTPPSAPRMASGKTNSFGTVYVNPTAICKLTGKQVADCTCPRCAKLKKG